MIVPAFVKTDDDRETEGDALTLLTAMLPGKERQELDELFGELEREEDNGSEDRACPG